jgi:competence protein ComEC
MAGLFMLFIAGAMFAISAPDSVTSTGAFQIKSDTSTFLGRQRLRAGRVIDTVFQQDAPIAKALLVADKTELPKELKQRYAAAGIMHRLSVSGLHVIILAGSIELLLALFGVPRSIILPAAVAFIAVYIIMLGFPLPALRSGAMFGISAISRMLQRPTSRWAILAGCAFIPLLDPSVVLAVGYQLNIVGMAGFLAGSALARRVVRPHFIGWRRFVLQSLCISAVATAVTMPLVAWWFGQVSFIAPITNVVVEPLLGVAQPILFLGLLLSPLRPIAQFLADAAHPLLDTIDSIASYAVVIPGASLMIRPAVPSAILAGIASVAAIVACVSRFPGRASLIACASMCAVIWIG